MNENSKHEKLGKLRGRDKKTQSKREKKRT